LEEKIKMEIKVIVGDITEIETEAMLVNLFEGVEQPGGATRAADQALGGIISQLISESEIKGKSGELTLIHTLGKIATPRLLVAGLGKQAEFNLDKIRRVMAEASRFLRKRGIKRFASIVHGAGAGGIEVEKSAQAMVEGTLLGTYTFSRHLTKPTEEGEITELILVEQEIAKIPPLEEAVRRGKIIAEATELARDLTNEPANFMTPSDLAQVARKVAQEYQLDCTILEKEKIAELGMGGLLGVAQGSHQPPKFIILRYQGDESQAQAIGLIGKGITFDSGGISIKPSEGMAEMKGDMAGAAIVIATLKAIAQLKPKVNVIALAPATENLPGGAALKPGDVIRAMNGKTIEISNTDAEGRLILADALSYARKENFSPLIDLATLTGACRVALGDVYTGAFTNNQELLNRLIESANQAGELVWQLPMAEEYREQNKSEVADVKNTGGRYGGAITAAQFLTEFAEDTPWVHLDIAGTSYREKEKGYTVKGATGVMVRTLINFVSSYQSGG
jgi:leucyl aminopeptidase